MVPLSCRSNLAGQYLYIVFFSSRNSNYEPEGHIILRGNSAAVDDIVSIAVAAHRRKVEQSSEVANLQPR
jgi:hypothetical protein